jgi:DNA-binding response OmpR family regulator
MMRWPDDRATGLGLAEEGIGVLYVVSDEDEPPRPATCLEDWIRLPGDERDIRARLETLELRSASHRRPPRVDGEGRLHHRGGVLPLPLDEAELAAVLTSNFDQLVPDEDLLQLQSGTTTSVRVRVTRLRAKVRHLDLAIGRVRKRGYRMQGM